jgi:hypothetical protein
VTLRDELLEAVQEARGIVGDLGMHQVQVLVRTRTWSSGKIQSGPSTVSDLMLGAPSIDNPGTIVPPHVKGSPADPEIKVGPITPFHPVYAPAGYTLQQLAPMDAPGVECIYVVTFNDNIARPYILAPRGLDASRPLRIMLTLKTLGLKVPF